jgi:hypothetical protein
MVILYIPIYQLVCSLVDGWDSANCGVIERDISRSMSRVEVTAMDNTFLHDFIMSTALRNSSTPTAASS